MSEIRVRCLRTTEMDAASILGSSQADLWQQLTDTVKNVQMPGGMELRRSVSRPLPAITGLDLFAEIEATSSTQLRDLMILIFLPAPSPFDEGLSTRPLWIEEFLPHLVLLFPEVCFRVVSDHSCPDVLAKTHLWYGDVCEKLKGTINDFATGYREWFDPDGARLSIREFFWPHEKPASERLRAWIVEDEPEYRDLLGYAAYRSGRYFVEIISNQENFSRRVNTGLNSAQGGVLIHALDLPFGELFPREDTAAEYERLRESWSKMLPDSSLVHRMAVTAAQSDYIDIKSPAAWRAPSACPLSKPSNSLFGITCTTTDQFGWFYSKRMAKQVIRGLRKPLPRIHHLLQSGLFPDAGREYQGLLDAFFDGREQPANGLHSPCPPAQAVAEALLHRARASIESYLPVAAAVCALDALRTLRGRSSTLFLDAFTLLSDAEVRIELEVASAAGGAGAHDAKARATESARLHHTLERFKLLPADTEPATSGRLWTLLRRRYLEAGAVEEADEALLEIHRAHWRNSWWSRRRRLIARPLRLWIERLKKRFDLGASGKASGFGVEADEDLLGIHHAQWRMNWWSRRRRPVAKSRGPWLKCIKKRFEFGTTGKASRLGAKLYGLFLWLARRLPIIILLLVALSVLLLADEYFVQHIRDDWSLHVSCIAAACALFPIFWNPDGSGWKAPAIRFCSWLRAFGSAITVLAAANLLLFSTFTDPVVSQSPCAAEVVHRETPPCIRFSRTIDSLFWTAGLALGSEVTPERFEVASTERMIRFPGGGGDLHSFAQSLLWILNAMVGWLAFGFAISLIYRVAVRQ
jgi:hypothetical protein